jgi:hypothetical protein
MLEVRDACLAPGEYAEHYSSDWRLGKYLLNESGRFRWYRSLVGKTTLVNVMALGAIVRREWRGLRE